MSEVNTGTANENEQEIYTPGQRWQEAESITAGKMNNIEIGLDNVYSKLNPEQASTLSNNVLTIDDQGEITWDNIPAIIQEQLSSNTLTDKSLRKLINAAEDDDVVENITFLLTGGSLLSATYQDKRTSDKEVTYDETSYARYWMSNWINISQYNKIKLNFSAPIQYTFRINQTDNSKNVTYDYGTIRTINASPAAALNTIELDVPVGANYFGFSLSLDENNIDYKNIAQELQTQASQTNPSYTYFKMQGIKTEHTYKNDYMNLLNAKQYAFPAYEQFSINKILCIGDSLTRGGLPSNTTETTGEAIPYPEWLSKIINKPVDSYAVSGISASGLYDSISQMDFTPYDTFIIWLGTNQGPMEDVVGTLSQQPTTRTYARQSGSSYVIEEVSSETYYYRKIIEEIIADVPTAKIILGEVFATATAHNTYDHDSYHIQSYSQVVTKINEVLQQIAAAYPNNVLGVAHLNDNTLYGDNCAYLHGGNTTNPHFSAAGYFFVAHKWLAEMRRLMHTKINKFNITSSVNDNNGIIYISPSGNDSNLGTKNSPLLTLSRALSNQNVHTVIAHAGTYNESIVIENRNIKIICIDGYATFTNSSKAAILSFDNCQLELSHINCTGNTNSNSGSGIQISNSTGIIKDCHTSANYQHGFSVSNSDINFDHCESYQNTNGTGFQCTGVLSNPSNAHSDDNYLSITHHAHRITLNNCKAYSNGANGFHNSINGEIYISNSEFYDNEANGVSIALKTQGIITNNYIYGNVSKGTVFSNTGSGTLPKFVYANNIIKSNQIGIDIKNVTITLASNIFANNTTNITSNSLSDITNYNSIEITQ